MTDSTDSDWTIDTTSTTQNSTTTGRKQSVVGTACKNWSECAATEYSMTCGTASFHAYHLTCTVCNADIDRQCGVVQQHGTYMCPWQKTPCFWSLGTVEFFTSKIARRRRYEYAAPACSPERKLRTPHTCRQLFETAIDMARPSAMDKPFDTQQRSPPAASSHSTGGLKRRRD